MSWNSIEDLRVQRLTEYVIEKKNKRLSTAEVPNSAFISYIKMKM